MADAQNHTTILEEDEKQVDFILVQKEGKSETHQLQNYRFITNLKRMGIKVEEEMGIKYTDLMFMKLHAPDKVLKSIADIHGVTLTFENDRTIPHYRRIWTFFKTSITKKPNFQDPLFHRCSESVKGKPTLTFTSAERIMLVNYLLVRTRFGALQQEYGLPKLLEAGNFEDAYPLHDGKWEWERRGPLNDRQVLSRFWANWRYFYKEQPMHIVYKYFGSEIAFHYAWLGFYTRMLFPAAILGVLVFLYGILELLTFKHKSPRIYEICRSDIDICPQCIHTICTLEKLKKFCYEAKLTYILDNNVTIVFTLSMAVWATLFLKLWRRTERKYKYKWNLVDIMPDIDELPNFREKTKNYIRKVPVTGVMQHYYPIGWKLCRYMISAFVCFLCILFVLSTLVFTTFTTYIFDYYMLSSGNSIIVAYSAWILYIYGACISALIVAICAPYLDNIAKKLTDKEVHRTQNDYLTSYIFKSYLMAFFNTYTGLIYTSLFKDVNYTHPGNYEQHHRLFGIASHVCPPSIGCIVGLSMQVFFLMVREYMILFIGNALLVPKLVKIVRNKMEKRKIKKKYGVTDKPLPQWELEYELSKPSDMFFLKSFLSSVLEYGIVTFFVAMMPLLPFLALFNNVIELRVSAQVLIRDVRRNVPKRITGLGAWNVVLSVITRLSFMISGCIIAFTTVYVHRATYSRLRGTLVGFVNDTLSEFLIADFIPTVRESIVKQFPNVTTCFYSGQRKHYNETDKYMPTDKYYQILSLQLVTVVLFSHAAYFLTGTITFIMPKGPDRVNQHLAHEQEKRLVKNLAKADEEVKQFLLTEKYH